MINDRPARVFAVIIETADVHETIEAQFLPGEFANFRDAFRVGELDGDFAAELRRFGERVPELGLELIGEAERCHGERREYWSVGVVEY